MLNNTLENNQKSKQRLKVKLTGHLKGSYSLAIVNRDFALALDKYTNLDVYIDWNEYNQDFDYNLAYLKDFPRIIELIEKSKNNKVTDVEIRNVWPVLQTPSTSKLLIDYAAWEESKLPEKLVKEYSIFDEFFTVSSFVKKSFENSGIKVPITNIGQGIDQIDSKELSVVKPKTDKITFLHISSGLPRKGVNDLIDSFMGAFKDRTDVELILKTYPNPQNTINEHLKSYGNQSNIKHICKDLTQVEIEDLYRRADVYVSPSRGEGFNRPVAEAMIRNIPVIVTGWSGHMDFCNEKNSLLVKYNIEDSTSHLSGDSSSWAVIDIEDLKKKLLLVVEEIKTSSKDLYNRVNLAREDCKRLNNWENVAKKAEEYLLKTTDKYKKLGVLTTWKTKCGIATHSESLLPTISDPKIKVLILGNVNSKVFGEDEANVIRCWDEKNIVDSQHNEVLKMCLENRIDHLLIQYHPGQHKFNALMNLITVLGENGILSTLDIHSTIDFRNLINVKTKHTDLFNSANKYVKTYIVHNENNISEIDDVIERNRIKVVQIGYNDLKPISREEIDEVREKLGLKDKKIIATHGYVVPHKGHDLIAEALNLLKDKGEYIFMNIGAFSDVNSQSVIAKQSLNDLIVKYSLQDRYIHVSPFLTQEEIYKLLCTSDIIIFPYKKNNESASGAVRNALLTDIPVLVSNEKVFDDIRDFVITLDSIDPKVIAENIERHVIDKRSEQLVKRKEYISKNHYSDKMREIINTIYNG